MATLSLRMRDDLKRKAQQLAKQQGVSLNAFVNATIAAAIAQQETLMFFSNRLKDVDRDALHSRVLKFMRKSRSGREPSLRAIERALRG
jgi:antitoxin component of RelBE/YafQ-DinJ toxin-antitoxin module